MNTVKQIKIKEKLDWQREFAIIFPLISQVLINTARISLNDVFISVCK